MVGLLFDGQPCLVSVGPVMTGLRFEQQSHRGLQRVTSTLYNGVQLTPYLRVVRCVSTGMLSIDALKVVMESYHLGQT